MTPPNAPAFLINKIANAHQSLAQKMLAHMQKNKARLQKEFDTKVKAQVQAIYERQRPAPVVEGPVETAGNRSEEFDEDEGNVNTARGLIGGAATAQAVRLVSFKTPSQVITKVTKEEQALDTIFEAIKTDIVKPEEVEFALVPLEVRVSVAGGEEPVEPVEVVQMETESDREAKIQKKIEEIVESS